MGFRPLTHTLLHQSKHRTILHITIMSSSSRTTKLISPYGGKLVNLIVAGEKKEEYVEKAKQLPTITLSSRSLCDLELLSVGAFSPLTRFMGENDYRSVVENMRMADGILFPIPITLPIQTTRNLSLDREIALVNLRNEIVAIMLVKEIYKRSHIHEAEKVYGTTDTLHPMVAEMTNWGKYYISGEIKIIKLPDHHSFLQYRMTPEKIRRKLNRMGWSNVISFQTRNPLHRGHEELLKRAINCVNGVLLLQPSVGITAPNDLNVYLRVRSYEKLLEKYFDTKRVILNILPIAMRLAGPRSAVWHAIIRRNFGANYFVVGRSFASPRNDSSGRPFYDEYEAQETAVSLQKDIGVTILPFSEIVYLPQEKRYEEIHRAGKKTKISLSGSAVRKAFLESGQTLPEWFIRPETAALLADEFPSLDKRGFCIWFTGLPCSGKSTLGEILTELLAEYGRRVTLLDGDAVRKTLSSGLGFSKKHRIDNLLRLGYVASEIVRHNGIAIVCTISPFESIRNRIRYMIGEDRFILVHLNTPLNVCKERDSKGMYERALSGQIKNFTGVNDKYEPPRNANITVSSQYTKASTNARLIFKYLQKIVFIKKVEKQ